MCPTWPYSCREIASVCLLAEKLIIFSFLIYIIAFFYLYTCIYYRNKPYSLLTHFMNKVFEIRKSLLAHGEILISVHIVYIHINSIKRDMIFPVILHNFTNLVFRVIAPSALLETECPFGSNIASAYHFSELLYYIIGTCSIYDIYFQIIIRRCYFKNIL